MTRIYYITRKMGLLPEPQSCLRLLGLVNYHCHFRYSLPAFRWYSFSDPYEDLIQQTSPFYNTQTVYLSLWILQVYTRETSLCYTLPLGIFQPLDISNPRVFSPWVFSPLGDSQPLRNSPCPVLYDNLGWARFAYQLLSQCVYRAARNQFYSPSPCKSRSKVALQL